MWNLECAGFPPDDEAGADSPDSPTEGTVWGLRSGPGMPNVALASARLASLGSLAAIAALAGCQGVVTEPSFTEPGARPGTFVAPTVEIQRMTAPQIERAVHQVFGPDVSVTLPADIDARPETFSSVEASRATVTRRTAELYEESALDVAGQVMAAAERYPSLAGCAPDPSAACARDAIGAFGGALFRRPLEPTELDRLSGIVEAGGADPEARRLGLQHAIAALLIAPSFLYAHHRGEPVEGEDHRRFTDWELANRLALFLWSSIPDEELLRAAEAGELGHEEGLEAQTRRMLADERADGLASRFFSEAWRVHHLDGDSKSTQAFPAWTAEMAALYRTELDLTIEQRIMREDADVRTLFVGDTTFMNGALAELYGVEVEGDDWAEVPLPPERVGVLTSGAVMAANANPNRTSPTHRGLFVLSQFLCGSLPNPPEGLDLSALDATGLTGRQIVEAHLEAPSCAGCHAVFDPLGLAFEGFDAIGMHRTEELGQPIDVSVEVGGRALDGPRELAEYLVDDPRTPRCIAHNLYGFAMGANAGDAQRALTGHLGDRFAGGGWSFTELVVALVTSDGFRLYREPGDAE